MYLIEITTPEKKIVYIPEGFGFTAHEYTKDKSSANSFAKEHEAKRYLQGYINPTAFWGSELKHRERMHKLAKTHKFTVVKG